MISIKFDLSEFEAKAQEMKAFADQVPFALSLALNEGAKDVRRSIIDDLWPSRVTVRNRSFLGWALRTEWSTKHNLTVEINDERAQGRGHLKLHDTGGGKSAKGRFAIPTKPAEMRGARGIRASYKPAAIKDKFVRNGVLFQRLPNHRLKALYALKATTTQPADVPFSQFFATQMRRAIDRTFPIALARASRTRVPR